MGNYNSNKNKKIGIANIYPDDSALYKLKDENIIFNPIPETMWSEEITTKFKLLGIDSYKGKEYNVCSSKNFQIMLDNLPENNFLFVINFMIEDNNSVIIYFNVDRTTLTDTERLFFSNEFENRLRNKAFKIVPELIEGSPIIKMAIEPTLSIIGPKQTYHQHDKYFEIGVDTSSSSSLRNSIGLVLVQSKDIIIDLQFHLHDNVIGGCRFNKVIF